MAGRDAANAAYGQWFLRKRFQLHYWDLWQHISGHTLLERYGMTEIGMALSTRCMVKENPDMWVCLPFVQVKLVDEQGQEIRDAAVPGELYVSGETVFKRYWNRPEETADSFDGPWFKTGDIAKKMLRVTTKY